VVLGRLGGLFLNHERVLYPAHRPPFTGRGLDAFPGLRLCRFVLRCADTCGSGLATHSGPRRLL
jgi:hypothetical protein